VFNRYHQHISSESTHAIIVLEEQIVKTKTTNKVGRFEEKAYFCNIEQIKLKYMEMTKEQVYQWLKEVKQNKKNTLERLTKIGIDEYEKRTGAKPTYIETI
jgi:uncharacterized protein YqfB (UPF0267 family)